MITLFFLLSSSTLSLLYFVKLNWYQFLNFSVLRLRILWKLFYFIFFILSKEFYWNKILFAWELCILQPHTNPFLLFGPNALLKGQTGSSHSSGHIPQRRLIKLGVKCHLPARLWVIWPCPPSQLISHLPGSPMSHSPPHIKDLTQDALIFAPPSHLSN